MTVKKETRYYCIKLVKSIKLHKIIENYIGKDNFTYQNGSYMIIKDINNVLNFDKLIFLLESHHLSEYINVYEMSLCDVNKLLLSKGEDKSLINKILK